MGSAIAGLALALAMLSPGAKAQWAPDVPEWMQTGIRNLKAAGVLQGWPDGLIRHQQPHTRARCALAIVETARFLDQLLHEGEQLLAGKSTADALEFASSPRHLLDDLKFLIRAAAELSPEVKAFGAPSEKLKVLLEKQIRLVEGMPQRASRFSDVPKGHWADDAVHTLRRAGILYGYPGGAFLGC